MSRTINEHGDQFRPTDGGHGVDIASQRADELDNESLAYIRARTEAGHKVTAIDLGGGFGAHAIRMAQAGAAVVMIDIADMATERLSRASADEGIPPDRLTFLRKDFAELSEDEIPADFDLLYSQRAIHYVSYRTALPLMRKFFQSMVRGGAIFLSAAGYDTEYGKTYPDRSKPIEDRFNHLEPDMQAKHGIEQKIVTYKKEEMLALLQSAGFEGIRVWTSRFGNIKAVARKPL